jgi:hypothetical protein
MKEYYPGTPHRLPNGRMGVRVQGLPCTGTEITIPATRDRPERAVIVARVIKSVQSLLPGEDYSLCSIRR